MPSMKSRQTLSLHIAAEGRDEEIPSSGHKPVMVTGITNTTKSTPSVMLICRRRYAIAAEAGVCTPRYF